jgi:photosynthetic reaction center cytochrome c subunit
MTSFRYTAIGAAALACGLLAGCERPPVDTVQHGFRGTGMEEVYNPRILAAQVPLNTPPPPTPAASDEGPRAREVYKNVKVLGDLSVAQFTRLMVAMTTWVSPEQGCGYCHNLENLADDSKYTKGVARNMLQMTQHVNSGWKTHVADTGVTCYTCHRGHPVPQQAWFTQPEPARNASRFTMGDDAGQNHPNGEVGLTSLPYDPFTSMLLGGDNIRVLTKTALPTDNRRSIKEAEWTYGLMIHFSKALGVNCTYCHNSRSFASWEGPPQRVNAWYGIRMVRDLNNNYLVPLTNVFPRDHLGPGGDVAKVACGTCHQGAYKPLWGAKMLQDYPALAGPQKGATPAAAPKPPAEAPVNEGSASPVPRPALASTSSAPVMALAAVAGQGATPTAVAGTSAARVLFRLDRTDLDADAKATIDRVAAAMKSNRDLKVNLSGYADRSGGLDHNLDLAKKRAFAVRDALKAAGVDEDRVVLRKPEIVVGTLDADWRRVDITPVP